MSPRCFVSKLLPVESVYPNHPNTVYPWPRTISKAAHVSVKQSNLAAPQNCTTSTQLLCSMDSGSVFHKLHPILGQVVREQSSIVLAVFMIWNVLLPSTLKYLQVWFPVSWRGPLRLLICWWTRCPEHYYYTSGFMQLQHPSKFTENQNN